MVTKPVIGVSGRWDLSNEIRPSKPLDMSTLGTVGIAPNKDDGIEFHHCYTKSTNDVDFWKAVGDGSPVRAAAEAAASSARNGQQALDMTVVFVPEGEGGDEIAKKKATIANIAGSATELTGFHTFTKASSHNARTPRLNFIAGGLSAFHEGDAANVAVTAMNTVNSMIFGFGFMDGPSSTETEAIRIRKIYDEKRLALIETAVHVDDGEGNLIPVGATPYVAGLQAFTDLEHGGIPSHLCGMESLRVAEPAREVPFDLYQVAIEGQRLLANQISFITRGDSMREFAAGDGGTLFVGAHTLSSDPLEQFVNVVRMQDYLQLGVMSKFREYLVGTNQSFTVAKNALRTVHGWLNGLAAQEIIYPNPTVRFEANASTPEDWRTGRLVHSARAEPRAPFMSADTTFNRDREAISIDIASLETYARLNLG